MTLRISLGLLSDGNLWFKSCKSYIEGQKSSIWLETSRVLSLKENELYGEVPPKVIPFSGFRYN